MKKYLDNKIVNYKYLLLAVYAYENKQEPNQKLKSMLDFAPKDFDNFPLLMK